MHNIEQQPYSTSLSDDHFRAAVLHGFVEHLVFLGDHGAAGDPFYAYDFPVPGRGVMRVTVTKPGQNTPEAHVAELQRQLAATESRMTELEETTRMGKYLLDEADSRNGSLIIKLGALEHTLTVVRQVASEQGRKLKRLATKKKATARKGAKK